MKIRRNLYIVIAVVLITLNLLVDLLNYTKGRFSRQSLSYNAGYFIGAHFFLLIGIVLLVLAYKLTQRIKAQNDKELSEAIKKIGESNS